MREKKATPGSGNSAPPAFPSHVIDPNDKKVLKKIRMIKPPQGAKAAGASSGNGSNGPSFAWTPCENPLVLNRTAASTLVRA